MCPAFLPIAIICLCILRSKLSPWLCAIESEREAKQQACPSFPQDAIKAEQFFPPVLRVSRGDADSMLASADNILEGEMRTGAQEHFYLETNACIAIPKGEDDEMEMIVSTQSAHHTQIFAAEALGIPANRVVVRVKRMGQL